MIFKEIQWKNLFSYGKGITKVKLDTNQTLNIIGTNGAGKSVFVEAIFFALTGKPLRKCKIEQVVNTTNKKNAWVKLKIQSGKREYEIERGTKPKVFTIKVDGKPLDEDSQILITQDHLELMLGYKRTNLKHTLIMSTTDYTPFLRLNAADKRAFIEDILAIEIFTVMNKIVKAKLSILKEEMQDIHTQIEKLEYQLDLIREYNKEQNTTNELMIDEVREKIASDKAQIDELKNGISALQQKRKSYETQMKGFQDQFKTLSDQLETRKQKRDEQREKYNAGKLKGTKVLTQIDTQISVKNKDLEFYQTNDICPKCKQPLKGKGIDDCLDELKTEIADLEKRQGRVQDEMNKVERLGWRIKEYETEKINPIKVKSDKAYQEASSLERELVRISESVKGKNEKINLFNRQIEDNELGLKTMLQERKGKLKDEKPVQAEIDEHQETARELVFKDLVHRTAIKILSDKGIKTYIINKYIPILNKLVNKYLQILSAPYQLVFDNELNEKIALKGYEKLSYNNFSEGERQRCDIALLFAFLDIAKMKNSLSSNLLIMDEVFDRSLDDDGIRGILNIIDSMKDKGFTVFNISHKHQLKDKFDVTYQVTKDQFSHLEIMS